MIDYKTIPPEVLKQAEQAAINWHYPDSIAKGIRDKEGNYIDEAETTIQIWLEGYLYAQSQTQP